MKSVIRMLLAALLAVACALPAVAADGSDPDWPCVQRRTGALSPGLMWPHPLADTASSGDAADLAAALALRRVGMEQAQSLIDGYAEAHPDLDETGLGVVFLDTFKRIDHDRERVLAGIARYAHSQAALARRIDAAHTEMTALSAAKEPDYDRMDTLEEQIDWDERIYRDRERALTYVCETPVLLEKRAYAVAQMLLKVLDR